MLGFKADDNPNGWDDKWLAVILDLKDFIIFATLLQKEVRAVFLILFFISFFQSVNAQRYAVQGFVTDESGVPLTGATVYLHETFKGVITDDSGYFKLEEVMRGNYHLHITYVGYHGQSLDIRVNDSLLMLRIVLQESHLELHEAVVEENALKLDKMDYPMSVQMLNQSILRKNQGNTLSQSLEHLPGVNSMSMGVGVSKPVIRGLSGNRIVVAENGIKQEGQQWGVDHGLEIDPFLAERVEIIKGPASLLYGSDAMGGVIHIKQPLIPLSGKHEGSITGLYRSVNNTLGSSFSAKGNTKGWVYRIRATVQEYGDYKVPADSFLYNRYYLPIYNQTLKNTAGKENHLSAQLGMHRNWGYSRVTVSNFSQKIGLFSGATGIPRTYQLTDDGKPRNIDLPNQEINHFKVVSNSNILVGKNWIEIDLGYQDNRRNENSAPHAHGQPVGSSTLAHGLRLRTLTLNTRYHMDVKKGNRVIGATGQYQQNRFNGFEFLLPNFETVQTGLFIFRKYVVNPTLVWSGGLRFDYGQTHIHRHVQTNYRSGIAIGESVRVEENHRQFYNWSGSIGLSKTFTQSLNVKANLGKTFRIPATQELSMNGVHHGSFRHEVGDPQLRPEEGIQADFSLNIEKKVWHLSFTPFANYFLNYIYLRPTARFSTLPESGQLFQYEQTRAFMAGGEVTLEYHPIESIHLEGGVEWVYGINLRENLPLPMMPPLQFKSAVDWEPVKKIGRIHKPYFRLAYQLANSQNQTDRNEKATPGYHLVNFALGANVKVWGKKEMNISVNARNILNTPYYNHLSRWRYLNLPEPGRNIMVQIDVPLW